MTESEYTHLAEATLQRLEQAIEQADGDFDYEFSAGGVLQIEFADGSVIVVNKQAAAQEIWVAAKSGGFHFRWDGDVWRDTRSDEELFAALSRFASAQSGGESVELQPADRLLRFIAYTEDCRRFYGRTYPF
jgi:CyaY protein